MDTMEKKTKKESKWVYIKRQGDAIERLEGELEELREELRAVRARYVPNCVMSRSEAGHTPQMTAVLCASFR